MEMEVERGEWRREESKKAEYVIQRIGWSRGEKWIERGRERFSEFIREEKDGLEERETELGKRNMEK